MPETDRLGDALFAFYLRLGELNPPRDADQHLRFATDQQGTFRGSQWGEEAWSTVEGRAVQDVLFSDDQIRDFFAPPPPSRIGALRGRVASFLMRIDSRDLEVVRRRIQERTGTLLDELVRDPVASTTWVVRGAEPPTEPFYVPPGITAHEVDEAALEALAPIGLPGGSVVTMADARTALTIQTSAARRQWGAFADGTAEFWGDVILERFLDSVWIASGVLPAPYLRYSAEEADFPAFRARADQFPHERAGRDPGGEAPLATLRERIEGVFIRFHAGHDFWWSPDFESEEDFSTARGLRAVAGLGSSLKREADGALAAMLVFSMADGLLRERSDDESVVIPRLALVLGVDANHRRSLRRQFGALQEIRHAIAHGSRPDLNDVEKFLGSIDDTDLGPLGDVLTPLKARAMQIGRRLLAAALFLTWDLGDRDDHGTPVLVPRMTRSEYLGVLAAAQSGDGAALQTVESWLPDWLRLEPPVNAE